MELLEKNVGPVLVVEVCGRLTADCSEEFKHKLLEKITENKRLVLDLSKLEYIDSTGLGAIVFILQKNSDNDGEMKLARLQGKPRIVFDITKAYKIFDIYDTVEEAIAALDEQ